MHLTELFENSLLNEIVRKVDVDLPSEGMHYPELDRSGKTGEERAAKHNEFEDNLAKYRYADNDRKFINSPNYKKLVIKKLNKIPFDLYIYIRENETFTDEIGMASAGSKPKPYARYWNFFNKETFKLLSKFQLRKAYLNYIRHPKAVHLLITHNDPHADGTMVLTPWIILHRLAHAAMDTGQQNFRESEAVQNAWNCWKRFQKIASQKRLRSLFIFRSAKLDNLGFEYELFLELFVHYCLKGEIKINPSNSLDDKISEIMNWKAETERHFAEIIQSLQGRMWTG